MMARLKSAWKRHPALTTGFLLAIVLACFFAVRSAVFMVYWADPAHRNQPIEGWMTPRYVVQSWKLPPEVMIEALDEGPMPGKRRTLDDIAADQGISLSELAARITLAAETFRSDQK